MKKRILSYLLACCLLLATLPVAALTFDRSQSADILYSLGLFQGVGYREDGTPDFALSRTPTRHEAITMLVRLLGKEAEALGGTWTTPFTDVADWALPYVGYAYANGLPSGTGDTAFGGGAYISATQYITLVLRALGYRDGVDFSWNAAWELSDSLGITAGEYAGASSFDRGDISAISLNTLSQTKKNTGTTLLAALLADGAVTAEQITASGLTAALTPVSGSKRILTSTEIYAKCAAAVFFITTYDVTGYGYATGSGFFIGEDGIAVTNYHVIEDAFAMDISTTDGKTYSDISVLAYDMEQDVAILKVRGGAPYPYLTVDTAPVTGGEPVYAIGNPEGLTSTISQGLISNPSRADFHNMMQISVAISSGSSGGALINQYGEAVGITTAGLVVGQNLNFAIPIRTAVQLPRGSSMTFAQVAAQSDLYDYARLPGAFDANWNEVEPNDTNYQAYEIENGTSVWGHITDEYCDEVLVRCNTTGLIQIFLFSDSENVWVNDLILHLQDIFQTQEVYGEHITLDDGSRAMYLEFAVTEPNLYEISLLSESMYQYYHLNTDYAFYYLFTPDGAQDAPT